MHWNTAVSGFSISYNLRAGGDRLLAENVQTALNSFDSLLGVDGSRAGDDDGLQGLFLVQHGLVVCVGATTELGLCSVELGLHWRAHGDQFSARSERSEVAGMAHTCARWQGRLVSNRSCRGSIALRIASGQFFPSRFRTCTRGKVWEIHTHATNAGDCDLELLRHFVDVEVRDFEDNGGRGEMRECDASLAMATGGVLLNIWRPNTCKIKKRYTVLAPRDPRRTIACSRSWLCFL